MRYWCDERQKVQTLTSTGVGNAAAGLVLHFLHMSEGSFSHDAGHLMICQRQTETNVPRTGDEIEI